ncbi:uncharacterized mitochondrial protein AtMg00310-like [Cryptomeria japonica]|uniref:uncharacterized mitochondrial protein AtMg00310-like n=1 Tax=Cryptomeria japonica TaxID=3369 RepID=UPI0025ACE159|nr:uncharacterized mitochondrial protein AtMg00310-like [Cryptomeria japonica]
MRKFFWNGANEQEKIPLLAWDKICQAKVRGGVGLRDWQKMNYALGAKLVWNIYSNPHQMWVKVLRTKYLDSAEDHRIVTIRNPSKGSAIWNFILECRKVVTDHLTWQVGNGAEAKLWEDSWAGHPALKDLEDFTETKEVLVQLVRDYMYSSEGVLGVEWLWKDLSTT